MLDLCQARLRSGRHFRLVPYDRLPPDEQNAFRSSNGDGFFGILLPLPESGLPAHSVSRDAALLFLALGEPACLPTLLTNLLGNRANERLRQFVLDQVFEVEQDGRFVSGPAATALLGDEPRIERTSKVARLSSEAIAYAQALESLQVHELAGRLYGFNVAPSSPALQRQFASDDRRRAFLSVGADAERLLRSKWHFESIADSWSMWFNSSAPALGYKLYVSPVLGDLPGVFAVAIQAFAQADCPRFKLGKGAYGLLRPDKLVAYFPTLSSLQRAAQLIEDGAAGAVAQGVPFSAPIDPGGLLSLGMDPPRFELIPQEHAVVSWRHWLSQRIAACIAAARQSGNEVQSFVRQRIALDGVDPINWIPDLAIWRGPLGTQREAA